MEKLADFAPIDTSTTIGGLRVTGFNSLDAAVETIVDEQNRAMRPGVGIAINPEKVVACRRDPSLRELFSKATLLYPDGIGVVAALRRKGVRSTRVPGCELWERLVQAAIEIDAGVFLVGGPQGMVEATAAKLREFYPGFLPAGLHHGYFDEKGRNALIDSIATSGARFVSVGMGSPVQEVFMLEAASKIPQAFFMGVGGTYEVFLGNVRRAPVGWRKVGLEWLYRLLSQPSRWRRQLSLLEFMTLLALGRL